jgi:hypothetical protein
MKSIDFMSHSSMRIRNLMMILSATLLAGCAPEQNAPTNMLVLHLIGGKRADSVKVTLSRDKESYWHSHGPVIGNAQDGTIPMTSARFEAIVKELQLYQSAAIPEASLKITHLTEPNCKPDETFVPDQNEMRIQWFLGDDADYTRDDHTGRPTQYAFVKFGCSPDIHAARYAKLRQLIEDLGIPDNAIPL